MRAWHLIKGEFRLLFFYGILFLYGIFTGVYLCLLSVIPQAARGITAVILIFTDPAAMGLFFMGAMVLLEKSQRVESSLAVSPVTISEYILGKCVPFMTVGVLVALILSCFSGNGKLLLMLAGVAFSSILFSMCGLLVGSHVNSLNGFMIATIPFEIFLCAPAILYLFDFIKGAAWYLHPGVAAIRLIGGGTGAWYRDAAVLLLWMLLAYLGCKGAVKRSFQTMGGAKL